MITSSQKLLMARAGVPSGEPWDIAYASYSGTSFSVSSQDAAPQGLAFKTDGTKMYVIGNTNDTVYEYDLSTAWDISTASYSQGFAHGQEATPREVTFKSDGTKMYITGATGDVHEYTISTAWDVSTASYSQQFSVSSQDGSPNGVNFKSDGTKMYIAGNSTDTIYEYDLSTAWDVSTASYNSNSLNVSAQETAPQDVFFKTDGTKMYIPGNNGEDINEYDLSTAWDVSTASYSKNFSVSSQDTSPQGLFFKDDGTKMFVLGNTNDAVFAYDIG